MQHAATILLPLFLAAVIYPVITGALNWYLWWDTPASWDAFVAANPKQAKFIRRLRAISPHLRKFVEVARDEAARRSTPVAYPRADEVALPRPAAPDAITALRARTLTGREGFDASERQVLAPDVVAAARREGERGSVDVRAMLALVVALAVALPLGVVVAGCPLVRDVAMRAAPGVPDPNDCTPGAQRCNGLVPVVCSATRREWPALPRSASGEQRTCAPGVCIVNDGGVAHCALAADGGAR